MGIFVDKRDGGFISLSLLVLVMLFFTTKYYRADVFVEKKNHTSLSCDGGGDGCVHLNSDYIGGGHDDDIELLEVLTDSYIGRVLAGGKGKSTTGFTLNAKRTISCGKGKPYKHCLGDKKPAKNCNSFNRECKKPKKK